MLMRQWDFHQTKAMQMTWMGSGTQHLTDAALLVGLGAQIITLEMSCLVRVKVNRVRMEREEAPNALRRVAPFLISRGRTEDCLGLLISRVKTEDCMGLRDASTCHSAGYVTPLSRAHMLQSDTETTECKLKLFAFDKDDDNKHTVPDNQSFGYRICSRVFLFIF